jgi:hypothetical protein
MSPPSHTPHPPWAAGEATGSPEESDRDSIGASPFGKDGSREMASIWYPITPFMGCDYPAKTQRDDGNDVRSYRPRSGSKKADPSLTAVMRDRIDCCDRVLSGMAEGQADAAVAN